MNSTGCPAGTGVALAEVVLLATIHPLSSKPGSASGFSVADLQVESAGSGTAGGPLSGARLARLPEAVRVTGTGRPFHHTAATGRGAHTSSGAAALVSPVSASTAPRTVPVRTSAGPLTSTGPAAVSVRQITAAAVSSAASSSSGRPPAGVTRIRVSPWWA